MGSDNKKQELINRLTKDMAANDIQGMNDAIFSVAYWSKGGEGQGQGNANVSKVHNGTWEVNVGDDWADVTWAEDNVISEGDGYIQDKVYASKSELKKWVDELNAVIYICGKQQGFGNDVVNCLKTIFGEARYQALIRESQIRVDLY